MTSRICTSNIPNNQHGVARIPNERTSELLLALGPVAVTDYISLTSRVEKTEIVLLTRSSHAPVPKRLRIQTLPTICCSDSLGPLKVRNHVPIVTRDSGKTLIHPLPVMLMRVLRALRDLRWHQREHSRIRGCCHSCDACVEKITTHGTVDTYENPQY